MLSKDELHELDRMDAVSAIFKAEIARRRAFTLDYSAWSVMSWYQISLSKTRERTSDNELSGVLYEKMLALAQAELALWAGSEEYEVKIREAKLKGEKASELVARLQIDTENKKIVEAGKAAVQAYIEQAPLRLEEESVLRVIRKHKQLNEKTLLSMIWRDMDYSVYEAVTRRLLDAMVIVRCYKRSAGVTEIWYYSTSAWKSNAPEM